MDRPLAGNELKPRPLKLGDLIEIVTPASPIAIEDVDYMTKLLLAEGYRVRMGEHALNRTGYLAGLDEQRAQDLQSAFDDPDVSAVLCARGGYGCARLFPYLHLETMAASGKMFLGFSDITTLHLALNKKGMPTVHAPMALTLSRPREDWVYESFKRVLRGNTDAPLEAPPGTTVNGGKAQGKTTGGCMCLLADSIGTSFSLDCAGKILLLEDVDEAPHRIDAMLTHLLNAGVLEGVEGIVVAEMTRTNERGDKDIGIKPWEEIITERLAPLGVPMILHYPFGHMPNMLSLALGITAELDADAGTLTYIEPLCMDS